jgi:hypothetical protein
MSGDWAMLVKKTLAGMMCGAISFPGIDGRFSAGWLAAPLRGPCVVTGMMTGI